jgi:ABC-type multidrug transport system fused ATPase/permease subunit
MASRLREARTSAVLIQATFDAVLDAIPSLANVALVLFGALRIRSGQMSIGDLSSMIYMFSLLVFPLRIIGYALSSLPHSLAGYDRVREVIESPVVPDPRAGLASAPAGIGLRLDRVGFAYEANRPVLRDLELTVPTGRTVAVVGATGSGKTTLLRVAAGLVAAGEGSVQLVAGPHALVMQEAFLLSDSLRANVCFGGSYDDDEVWRALGLAEATEFVADLPGGLDAEVGERGVSLSGGQRQRIALARALVRRPQLLLLDDTTSALDPSTEARVVTNLRRALAGATVVVVASRPSTIALADEVVFLADGRVGAHGSHAALLESHAGYREIMEAFELERAATSDVGGDA